MEKTFFLGQSNELIKNGRVYDIHNLYGFTGFLFEVNTRRLQIRFDPLQGKDKEIPAILLVFIELDYFELSPDFGTLVCDGLDEMGYKSPEDKDDEWLLGEKQSSPGDHLFFRLDNGCFIRIHSKYADMNVISGLKVL